MFRTVMYFYCLCLINFSSKIKTSKVIICQNKLKTVIRDTWKIWNFIKIKFQRNIFFRNFIWDIYRRLKSGSIFNNFKKFLIFYLQLFGQLFVLKIFVLSIIPFLLIAFLPFPGISINFSLIFSVDKTAPKIVLFFFSLIFSNFNLNKFFYLTN